jgi:hypothetical protein
METWVTNFDFFTYFYLIICFYGTPYGELWIDG